MTTTLHTAVAAIAQQRGAMVISKAILSDITLKSLRNAAAFGAGGHVEIASGNQHVAGRFAGISINVDTLTADLTDQNGAVGIDVGPGFVLTIELLIPGGGLSYSTIELSVPATHFGLSASGNIILFEPPRDLVEGNTVPTATRAAAIAATGIDPNELLRLEGSIAYGSGSRLVNSALGTMEPIDLAKMFPAFEFGGVLELKSVGGSLLVFPETFKFIGNTGCPKGDATAGLQITPQSSTDQNLTRTWPVLARAPTPQPVRPPQTSDGVVAAYLPKTLLDVHFGKVSPAITYRDHDDGFIGYDVELSAAIRGITVTIDATEMALRLNLDFASWGLLVATVDVPCVGRMDLAQARFEMPKNNQSGSVEAIVRLAVDTAGRLTMLTELGAVNLGEAMVSVQLFSKYLTLAGGNMAVYGFIMDAVLGRVIANNLPGLVFDAIKGAVNQQFFVLADLGALLGLRQNKPNRATWSDDGTSTLMGLTYEY